MAKGKLRTPAPTMAVTLWKAEYHHFAFLEEGTRVRKILTYTGVAALVAVAVNLVLSVINSQKQKEKKRDLLGLRVFVNLSASEIHRLADQIIAKSNETHDLVSSVPLEN
ncbi:hypothetical protein HPP92_008946, partial [Vanilla planifolia]